MIKAAADESISRGTLNLEHLLPRFAEALASLVRANEKCQDDSRMGPGILQVHYALIGRASTLDPTSEAAVEFVHERLVDALDLYAPLGYYFGAHEGDASDFGFWPYEASEPDADEPSEQESYVLLGSDGDLVTARTFDSKIVALSYAQRHHAEQQEAGEIAICQLVRVVYP